MCYFRKCLVEVARVTFSDSYSYSTPVSKFLNMDPEIFQI